ncbi:hypothetical protein OG552_16620 [Streptomyces sp. NBC_01476]|uniref:hypothetical protein n=1 Tax=Streptomyces sp. NBC_01476 TaxID=2903881 RepID=UPI002E380157|nr:hypothetical protein [Streptomyces sp. NBC_01476]
MDPMDYPEIAAWARELGEDVDSVDFLAHHTPLSHWLAIGHVMWPRFVEADGCVLWSRVHDPDNFRSWQDRLPDRPADIERTLNQLKLWQVIESGETPSDDAALKDVAEVIARTWRAALADCYPDRRFDVDILTTEDGPIVTFSTRR